MPPGCVVPKLILCSSMTSPSALRSSDGAQNWYVLGVIKRFGKGCWKRLAARGVGHIGVGGKLLWFRGSTGNSDKRCRVLLLQTRVEPTLTRHHDTSNGGVGGAIISTSSGMVYSFPSDTTCPESSEGVASRASAVDHRTVEASGDRRKRHFR